MFGLGAGLGLDLGTANVRVYVRGRGVALCEPSVAALDRESREIVAVGAAAREMLGRTPEHLVADRPLRHGVIADFTVCQGMVRRLLDKVCGSRRLLKPVVVVSNPQGATSVERRAVLEAALAAGAKRAYALEAPMAAAIGAGLPVGLPCGTMVLDIGAGATDMAVISLGGIVVGETLRLGGDQMDQVIARHLKRAHNLLVGERSAEEIKIGIGSAYPLQPEAKMAVRGRDLMTGLPQTVTVSSEEIREALSEPIAAIVARVRALLEQVPPELASDIAHQGITLTGGGALLRGMDRLLAAQIRVPVQAPDDPMSCVVVGAGKYLDLMREFPAARAQPAVRA